MNRTALAMILATLGTLAMLSGVFELIPANIATFAAVGLYIVSGLAWWLPWGPGRSRRDH